MAKRKAVESVEGKAVEGKGEEVVEGGKKAKKLKSGTEAEVIIKSQSLPLHFDVCC